MGIAPYITGLPGIRSSKTANHKTVFRGSYIPDILPQGRVIDGLLSRDPTNTTTITNLQPGLLLGKVTATGYYAPSIIGPTTGAAAVGATTLTVGAATVTELVRRFGASGTFTLLGPPAASGVVQSETVTYSAASGTTVTCTATVNPYISGAFILPADGSQEPLTFIPDGYGIPVADQDGSIVSTVQFAEMPISGCIQVAQLVNWPTDTSLQAWIFARLNGVAGGHFTSDGRY